MKSQRNVVRLVAALVPCFSGMAMGFDGIAGSWSGALTRDGAVQLIHLQLEGQGSSLSGTIDIPELGMFAEPLKEVHYESPNLTFRFIYGVFTCVAHSEIGEITGVNDDWGPPVRVHLKKGAWQRQRVRSEEVTIPSDGVSLRGTLLLPVDAGPHAVVVLAHGSGQSGRSSWTYRSLAHVLARNGIAALMYDKRAKENITTGSSFDALAGDVVAAVAFLKRRGDIDSSAIGAFGASQGGWIAPMAAVRSGDVSFVILKSGPSVSVWDQEVHRVKYTMLAEGFGREEVEEAVAFTRAVFEFVDTGRGWDRIETWAARAKEKKWAEIAQIPTSKADAREWLAQRYDPEAVLSKLKCPLLALFGENDTLVPPAENLDRMKQYLKRAENSGAKIVVFDDVGHDLELSGALVGDRWSWPEAFWRWPRSAPGYYDLVVDWINQRR